MKTLRPIVLAGLAAVLALAAGACTLTIDPRDADKPAAKETAAAKVAGAEARPREFRRPGRRGEFRRWHKGDPKKPGWRRDGRGPGPGYGRHHRDGRRFIGRGLGKRRTARDLTVGDVRQIMAGRLAWRGNKRLKLGKVAAKDDKTIVVEVVTVDNSLVRRMEIDRATGRISWPIERRRGRSGFTAAPAP